MPCLLAADVGGTKTLLSLYRVAPPEQGPAAEAVPPEPLAVERFVSSEWDDPAAAGMTWNVYRDDSPDPAEWGAPHEEGVSDAEPGTPGIQYRDLGAVPGTAAYHYLITAVNECGETDLR